MKFQIYQDGHLVNSYDISGAYVFGPDRTPLRVSNQLVFNDSMLQFESDTLDSAGMCLLWHVKGFGKVLLPTTKLRYRKEPYNLNLELARARIMQITIKREDWAFFDESNSLGKRLQELQSLFIDAVNSIADPSKCSLLADKCLEEAMCLSELFAQKYAESYLSLRHKNKSFGRYTLGCSIQADKFEEDEYSQRLFDMYGSVSVPSSWANIESEKGVFDFSELDNFLNKIVAKKVFITFGPLLCFSKINIPEWLIEENPSFAKIQEYAYNYVHAVVSRYARKVHFWRIIAGMNACNCFGFNFEQIIEMTRTATIASKVADAKSKKIIEVMYPWGEYYAKNQQTVPPLVYVDMIMQSGISFDAFGLQLNFGKNQIGMHLRDMMQISSRLDCFAAVSKPLHITSVTVPSVSSANSSGFCGDGWNQQEQAKWVELFVKIALGKPFVSTITYSSLCESKELSVPGTALLTKSCEPKKVYKTVGKLQKYLLKK